MSYQEMIIIAIAVLAIGVVIYTFRGGDGGSSGGGRGGSGSDRHER